MNQATTLTRAAALATRLESELGRAVIGQREVIREILIAFLSGGHCLLRGVPGLAKTLLIRKLAEAVDLKFSRLQFTPDLMPSDIIGAEMIEEERGTGKRAIRFVHGPVFANIVLADEINRTPPKTQAALLEAMQEYQVTVAGVRYPLPRPFFVLATQNPIEQEGTMCTVGYDDDGVKPVEFPIVREGILVGLQTNRETAHFVGERPPRGARSRPRGGTIRSSGCRTFTWTRARRARRRRRRSSPTRRTAC